MAAGGKWGGGRNVVVMPTALCGRAGWSPYRRDLPSFQTPICFSAGTKCAQMIYGFATRTPLAAPVIVYEQPKKANTKPVTIDRRGRSAPTLRYQRHRVPVVCPKFSGGVELINPPHGFGNSH